MTELRIHQQHEDELGRANCPAIFTWKEDLPPTELATGFELSIMKQRKGLRQLTGHLGQLRSTS